MWFVLKMCFSGISITKVLKIVESIFLGVIRTSVQSNQDFNSFTDPGRLYISGSGSISTTLSHRPSDLVEAFIMKCYPTNAGNIGTQIMVTAWQGLKIYKRSYDSGDWRNWQKVEGVNVEYAV